MMNALKCLLSADGVLMFIWDGASVEIETLTEKRNAYRFWSGYHAHWTAVKVYVFVDRGRRRERYSC